MSTTEQLITTELHGHVMLIGLNRADKRNAMNSSMLTELSLALGEFERNNEARCAVLFAHGEHFTAGLDLMELAPKLASGSFRYPEEGIDPWGTSGIRRTKPVVAAIHGTCWTAGIELMLNADLVVAASNSRFAHLEVLRGIPPSGGSTVRFTAAAGWADAMRYMLIGEEFDATEALRMRLINEVTEAGEVLPRALELAEKIAKAAPLAVQATLKSAFTAVDQGQQEALNSLNDLLLSLMTSKDVQEGVMAMMQKREPVFKGC